MESTKTKTTNLKVDMNNYDAVISLIQLKNKDKKEYDKLLKDFEEVCSDISEILVRQTVKMVFNAERLMEANDNPTIKKAKNTKNRTTKGMK